MTRAGRPDEPSSLSHTARRVPLPGAHTPRFTSRPTTVLVVESWDDKEESGPAATDPVDCTDKDTLVSVGERRRFIQEQRTVLARPQFRRCPDGGPVVARRRRRVPRRGLAYRTRVTEERARLGLEHGRRIHRRDGRSHSARASSDAYLILGRWSQEAPPLRARRAAIQRLVYQLAFGRDGALLTLTSRSLEVRREMVH